MNIRFIVLVSFFCWCLFPGCGAQKNIGENPPSPELLITRILTQEEDIQLSLPVAHYKSTLFEDSMALDFAQGYPGSVVRYTTDGSQPDETSPVFAGRHYLTSETLIKAGAFHAALKKSPVVTLDFIQVPKMDDVKSITIVPEPNEKYKGQGAKSLIDLNKGSLNFKEAAWMGFSDREIEIAIDFDQPRKVSKVMLSTMADHGSWIFLPEEIEVSGGQKQFTANFKIPEKEEEKRLEYLVVSFDEIKTDHLQIRIRNLATLPAWHSGAGNAPWFFMDEIVIK
ncbi:MAG: chitobiase/beta-hexosaminidase C-terminal domain-containing protein [Lewinellaceae bacterium]|nr:chitobiase/beta-hexosaminidase C-terminal domain-containing protein [Lewinellaceae bacterium]